MHLKSDLSRENALWLEWEWPDKRGGLWWEWEWPDMRVAFGGSGLIRGVAFGGSGSGLI